LTVHGEAILLYGRVALILPPNSTRDRCGFVFPFSVTREPRSSALRGQLVPGLLLLVLIMFQYLYALVMLNGPTLFT
jgi:hypothetical protein